MEVLHTIIARLRNETCAIYYTTRGEFRSLAPSLEHPVKISIIPNISKAYFTQLHLYKCNVLSDTFIIILTSSFWHLSCRLWSASYSCRLPCWLQGVKEEEVRITARNKETEIHHSRVSRGLF